MQFPEKNVEKWNNNNVKKLSAKEPFFLALIYPSGWVEQNTTFELTDIDSDGMSTTEPNVFGAIAPTKVLFKCVPSHLTALVTYEKDVTIELAFNTVRLLHGGPAPKEYLKENMTVFDYYMLLMQLDCSISVSPGSYEKWPEYIIDASVALIRDVLISYWLGPTK